ncbi:MAG: RNA methyltransferase [Treponema sp.]
MEVIVVLARPETSLNVGAICRVMANTDLSVLRIVGDRNIYNETEVLTLALHARYLWDNAQFFPATIEGLKQATSDCNAVFATTRREGIKRKHQGLLVSEFLQFSKKESFKKIAIVFGNERTGLTDEEVSVCSHSIHIQSSENYPSYNLSHAVLIIAYSLFVEKEKISSIEKEKITPLLKWKNNNEEKREIITFNKSSEIAKDIVLKLEEMGLYRKGGDKDCEIFLSQMISRAKLTEEEAEFFQNIFHKLSYQTKKPTI